MFERVGQQSGKDLWANSMTMLISHGTYVLLLLVCDSITEDEMDHVNYCYSTCDSMWLALSTWQRRITKDARVSVTPTEREVQMLCI